MGTLARLRGIPRRSSGNPTRNIKSAGYECPSYDEESRGLRRTLGWERTKVVVTVADWTPIGHNLSGNDGPMPTIPVVTSRP
ncbi:MAG: hypothetical protein JWN70_1833 [Planctomycetaceae bacterium]|nr:hypothetical protein [Planctomycetaceae bacterium]